MNFSDNTIKNAFPFTMIMLGFKTLVGFICSFLNICVWLVLLIILHVPSLQDKETAWPVFPLLLSVALSFSFPRLQGMFFQANLKNALACSCRHTCIVLVLVSIGYEMVSAI